VAAVRPPKSALWSATQRAHTEHVVADIGGDVGALIVHTDAALLGVEESGGDSSGADS
jgi:hypothetical protein